MERLNPTSLTNRMNFSLVYEIIFSEPGSYPESAQQIAWETFNAHCAERDLDPEAAFWNISHKRDAEIAEATIETTDQDQVS